MTTPLSHPPRKEDPRFDDWVYLLWKRITQTTFITWLTLDKTGSNLTDIITRNHSDLQNIQGGAYHVNSVFLAETSITITSNQTLTTGMNGFSVSPVTLADGVTLTIPDGATWLIG
jgi:hypothetical protein